MNDLVFSGARVIDPETGWDAIGDVAVTGGEITAVSRESLPGRVRIDVTGLVLCPGFIDLHSHAQSVPGHRLHALDGVTTALDLEVGRRDVPAALRHAEDEGRPLNFGFSAGWASTRAAMDGPPIDERRQLIPMTPGWNQPWRDAKVEALVDRLGEQLNAGALGVGLLLGYAPEVTRAEYLRVARLAAEFGVPTFTHSRYVSLEEPGSSLEGILEIVAAATGTGARMHVCHLNSTSTRRVDEIAAVLSRARSFGVHVTTEAYPYAAGATSIGAAFLDPAVLHRMGLRPSSITHLGLGRRLRDLDELARLRAADPTAPVFIEWADETVAADRALLERSLLFPDTAIASDSMSPLRDGAVVAEWPIGPGAVAHPRSAGCFAKVFRWLVRERGVLTLPEAVRRCTLVPAQILAPAAPAMRRKARVQAGCDADLTVFDPDRFADRATYADPAASTGVVHSLVAGDFVVRDGELVLDAFPGRPIRAGTL